MNAVENTDAQRKKQTSVRLLALLPDGVRKGNIKNKFLKYGGKKILKKKRQEGNCLALREHFSHMNLHMKSHSFKE